MNNNIHYRLYEIKKANLFLKGSIPVASSDPDLSALMQAAQHGDKTAYQLLLHTVTPQLRAYLNHRFFYKDYIDDVLQETLMALHRARHTYRPEQPFENWMYGIARHKLIDAIRKYSRHTAREILTENVQIFPVTQRSLSSNMKEEELEHDILKALAQLSKKQREAVRMTKINGLSVSEAAEKTGLSESAIKVNTHRGLKKMQEWLARHGYEQSHDENL